MTHILQTFTMLLAGFIFTISAIDAIEIPKNTVENSTEILDIEILSYEEFSNGSPDAINKLKQALLEKGIVGIRSIPGYKEKVINFIHAAKEFAALSDEIKQKYAPNRESGDMLGYEIGKEKFQKKDGSWIVDDSKSSYYAIVRNDIQNKWPVEINLQVPFEDIAEIMFETGKKMVVAIELINQNSLASLELFSIGRMLHYVKQSDATMDNPLWCGAHFDHGLMTALLPSFYFVDGEMIPEPSEAGLFVRLGEGTAFRKVVANDPDVLLFQVGEFGQIVSNDAIKATEHRVHKARKGVERYTMALFMSPAMDTVVESNSILTQDVRYGNAADHKCTFQQWHEASLNRYLVKDN